MARFEEALGEVAVWQRRLFRRFSDRQRNCHRASTWARECLIKIFLIYLLIAVASSGYLRLTRQMIADLLAKFKTEFDEASK